MSSPAPLILVVGMHRSGTSLLGQLLQALGVALPGELIGADRHNPAGYCERHDVTALQEQLLIELGRWWPGPTGTLPLPEGWLESPAGRRAAAQLGPLLAAERDRQQGPWAIKDPRTSLLLPLWRQLGAQLGIPLKLVHAVRAPAEVMVSLLQRDACAAGMTPVRAQQLWWHHNVEILRDAGPLPRLVVHYSRWFDQQCTHQLEALARFCATATSQPADLSAAHACIRPEHRRSQRREQLPQPIHRRLRRLERELLQADPSPVEPRPAPQWRRHRPLLAPGPLPRHCRLEVVGYGATPCHWSIHAWLQRCPLPDGFELRDDPSAAAVGLHLQPLALTQASSALARLRQLPLVLDPCAEQVLELRRLGVRAFWLDPQGPSSGWLTSAWDGAAAAASFGLPDPAMLKAHGKLLALGSGGDRWEHTLEPPLWALPGFDALHVANAAAARLLAAWLNQCNRSGLQLLRLAPSAYERASAPFAALDRPGAEAPLDWLPPVLIEAPIDAEGLAAELAWQRAGRPLQVDCATPTPVVRTLWQAGASEGATATVCVSLFNYADRILAALDSVRLQTQPNLELIVVDDASSDDGAERVQRWLQHHGSHFHRAVLLQHHSNAGLAAARNSAFTLATTDWCFVLDADNQLEPEALSLCLAVAESSPASTAVVHPLVELCSEACLPGQPEAALLSRIPWQRQALQHGNQIDAMALVRRRHWHAVGGFSHIPGGWEDFDFWCKLIDAGFHGVICPQRLAVYNRHSSSMQATTTLRQLAPLQRLLSARHPWLTLRSDLQP